LAYPGDREGAVRQYSCFERNSAAPARRCPPLRQVLINLCGNAVKFTERGAVTLEALLESQRDGTATIHFAATDTGIGIRPDRVASLFSPFVQADSSTTRKYGGTGLGLAISKQLVEIMGGTIGVDSQEGTGSTFWFTAVFGTVAEPNSATALNLSATNQAKAASRAANQPFGATSAVEVAVGDVRILVVEDNSTNQKVISRNWKRWVTRLPVVDNGAEAVEAFTQGKYDLLLMDWQMPIMGGAEATRRIRDSSHLHVPMTGDREMCILAGVDDYLAKPVELGRLAGILAKWIAVTDHREPFQGLGEPLQLPRSVFNKEALLDRLMQDKVLAGKVMTVFLCDCPSNLDSLRRRLNEANALGAGRQLHTLQGGAATVSAEGVHAFALEMEGAVKAGQLDRAGAFLPRAAAEFERFKQTVESIGWQ
jgi:CheY-like chemotaxis protein/HPt (histidine-containing phosphotransfer) domain-containing protein